MTARDGAQSPRMPIAVLASGSGSNLQALLDDAADPACPYRVAVVLSNKPGAHALERAARAGVPTALVPHTDYASRADFEHAILDELDAHDVHAVVLAGFMRVLTAVFVDRWPDRLINVHPALLPAFPGMHGAQQAIDAGVRIAGCTVHFVDTGVDTGPILGQAAVPVRPGDDAASLQKRIQAEEHRLLPAAVRALATGRIARDDGGRVRVQPSPNAQEAAVQKSAALRVL